MEVLLTVLMVFEEELFGGSIFMFICSFGSYLKKDHLTFSCKYQTSVFARFSSSFFLGHCKKSCAGMLLRDKKKRPFRTPAKVEPLAPATWNLDHNRAIRSRTSVSNLMCVRWIVFELQMRFSSTGAWEYQVLLAFFMPKFYCFTKYSADFERLQKSTRLLQRLEIWTVTAQYGLVQTCQIWCACDE